MAKKKSLEEKFWDRVDKTPGYGRDGDCWIWTKGRSSDGYGMFYLGKRNNKNHYARVPRFAYAITHGEIPEGMLVLHSCDNILCCNPIHLSIGTPKDNMIDMVQKRRSGYYKNPSADPVCHPGEKNPRARLTNKQVMEMRLRYQQGEKPDDMAKDFPVTAQYITQVVCGAKWKHLPVLKRVKSTTVTSST